MVTHLNLAVDDSVGDRARDIKEKHDLTWEGFVVLATELMEDKDVTEGE